MPKIAFSRRRSVAIVRLSVHVVPLLSAVLLISVNLATWYPRKAPSIPALQFIAKAIELFTQASIAHLVLFHIRHQALGQRAIPFGALFAGLQTANISYLWSLEFIGTMSASWCSRLRRYMFVLFIGLNVILAAGVGPSIAIALIPRTQPFPFGSFSMWLQGSEMELFPFHLNESHVPTSCLDTSRTTPDSLANLECPWRALPAAFEMAKTMSATSFPPFAMVVGTGDIRPLWAAEKEIGEVIQTMPFTLGPDEAESQFLHFLKNRVPRSAMMATATTKGLTQACLATLLRMAASPQSGWPEVFKVDSFSYKVTTRSKQALEWTQCKETLNPYDSKSIKLPGIPNHSHVDIPNIQPSPHWRLIWADVNLEELPISIATIVVPPSSLLEKTFSTDDEPSSTSAHYNAFACTISASWANTILEIDSSDGGRMKVEGNITAWPKTAVRISSGWANLLLSKLPFANEPNTTLFDTMVIPALQQRYANETTELLLSGLIVAAMSQTITGAWNFVGNPKIYTILQKVFNGEANPTNLIFQNGTAQNPWARVLTDAYRGLRLDFDVTSVGLAYSPRGIPTIIALVVLFTYSFYVFLSIVYIISVCPESSSAWDSISELTTLAILSTPTDRLRNTSAGIETLSTFREPVNVRATKDNKLEIVFEKDGRDMAVESPKADKAY